MSAFGLACDFFQGASAFSLPTFRNWMRANVIDPPALLARAIVDWLPNELCSPINTTEQEKVMEKYAFVREVATDFLERLEKLASHYHHASTEVIPVESAEEPNEKMEVDAVENGKQEPKLLLDILFDEGLLPSYAFPTDLCTFYVFEQDGKQVRIKERPQQGKEKALSEYAPGRLLVVDKETYRVGGVYDESAPPAFPVQELFASPLGKYVYCPQCTYVREEPLRGVGETCPICRMRLVEREMVDPPGFSPEGGRPLHEQDREQEISYATGAQFPTPLEPDQFEWKTGAGHYLRYAYEQNKRLVIVNKGPEEKGFRICKSCGAAWPEAQDLASLTRHHERPFLLDWRTMKREKLSSKCTGPLYPSPIYLGHSFATDLLLLRIELRFPLRYDPRDPWLHDALRSTAEALALAASLHLDIDPGELSANYRLISSTEENTNTVALADIYLFDTASGGAGYAAEAGDVLPEILSAAIDRLEACPGNCERSCTKCMRHYGNRYWHNRLDRHLAIQLLRYAKDGQVPLIPDISQQSWQLAPLQRFLELEGWQSISNGEVQGVRIPLLITRSPQHEKMQSLVAVGTYSALLDPTHEDVIHQLHGLVHTGAVITVLLNDYVVTRDLPTAYKHFLAGLPHD